MANITLNSVANTGYGSWLVSAYSTDCTTAQEIKAAVSGKSHFIKKIRVDYIPGTTPKYFEILGGSTILIGLVNLSDYSSGWEYEFIEPLKVAAGSAINILQETAAEITVIMEGFTQP